MIRPLNFELVRFKDAHMLAYKNIRNVNDKLATFAYAVHYILLWPILPFQLKPLKASTEVNSEFTVISDDRVRSRTPTCGCILRKKWPLCGYKCQFYNPELLLGVTFLLIRKMTFMWVQMSGSGKNSVK